MNWQKSLKNVGRILHISGDFNNYPYPAMSRNKVIGCPCNLRCNLTPRHWAFLETAWAANEQKWWHTNRLRTRLPYVENCFSSLRNRIFCQWHDWCGCSDESVCVYSWHVCDIPDAPIKAHLLCRFLGMVNKPFPRSRNSHFKNGAKCETFAVQMSFICVRIKKLFSYQWLRT